MTNQNEITVVHICSFSGKVADLSARETRDKMKVLACLKADPMVSTFDMGEKGLYKTIELLVCNGLIVSDDTVEYPWLKYNITEAGLKELEKA